ncbi:cupin domain-containing protein [Alteribacillus sp. HJP-4]|uniref:cupin domain-containing protein n=1 Tax=Alteribacillus sp. HJP-4 TaxID=2775394 RepID=UPI0035CCCF45
MKKENVLSFLFKKEQDMPNNEHLPVLFYRGAFKEDPAECEAIFHKHYWKNSWRGSVLDYHHFHSNAHEVLGVANGEAKIKIGGKKGTTFDVAAGDVIVLPAGTGHKKMDESFNFQVIGAYPGGADYNMKTAYSEKEIQDITEVSLPDADPVFGREGPLTKLWKVGHNGSEV